MNREEKLDRMLEQKLCFGFLLMESAPGSEDTPSQSYLVETEAAVIAIVSKRMEQVRLARKKSQQGTYGICSDCESPIGEKRLTAAPEATRCIRCQEIAEGGDVVN